jgi:hypothetical protein
MEEDEMDRVCSTHGRDEKGIQFFLNGKHEGRRPHEWLSLR